MRTAYRTNRGLVRKNNEDSILVREPELFAIADGMGGEKAGEVASLKAVHGLNDMDLSSLEEAQVLPYIRQSIEGINAQIWNLAVTQSALKGMGTTLTVLYLNQEKKGFVGHVGDSRIYLWQDESLKQVTSDHSYVAELVRQKQLTPEEAENSEKKHMILRAVGAAPVVEVDTFEFILAGAQKLLLCSDGLSNMVEQHKLEEIFREKDVEALADRLLEEALLAGGRDNISFIIIDLEA